MKFPYLYLLSLLSFGELSFGQIDDFIHLYRSVSSYGLGEQGVASRNGIDAMIYNPANLIHTDGAQLAYFRNPFYYTGFGNMPFKSYVATIKLTENSYLGAEFISWDQYIAGATISDNPAGYIDLPEIHSYNRSFALNYALTFSDDFGYGFQIRYTKDKFSSIKYEHFWGSAGIQYIPSTFEKKLRLGFSFMNFSTPISVQSLAYPTLTSTTERYSPSSFLRLGFEYDIIHQPLFTLTVHSATSKRLVKNGGNAESSFEALFNDWHDAPRDMTFHSGLSFVWNPIPLGENIAFIQEMFCGHLTDGPRAGSRTTFYNGINAGIAIRGVQFLAGYASMWHLVNSDVYYSFFNYMPWETFQFTVKNALGYMHEYESPEKSIHGNIMLTLGWGYTQRIGRYAEYTFVNLPPEYMKIVYPDRALYDIESAFYFSEQSALTTSLYYTRLTPTYKVHSPMYFEINLHIETLTLTSSYRYHPLESLANGFFEIGVGVQRQNPIENTNPKYNYNTITVSNIGMLFPVSDIVLIPKIGFSSLLARINGPAPRLGGYNQLEFSLNVGYKFE
jgi:hypothetical protein